MISLHQLTYALLVHSHVDQYEIFIIIYYNNLNAYNFIYFHHYNRME